MLSNTCFPLPPVRSSRRIKETLEAKCCPRSQHVCDKAQERALLPQPPAQVLFPWEMALRFQAAHSTQKPTFGTAATGQRRRLNAGCHGNHRSQSPSQCTGNPNSTSYWKLLPKRQYHCLDDFSDVYMKTSGIFQLRNKLFWWLSFAPFLSPELAPSCMG